MDVSPVSATTPPKAEHKVTDAKPAILLAAFGSASRQGEAALHSFDVQTRARFPDHVVRWAFTSELMRERLASVRKKADSVAKALRRMAFERFTSVVVQPLHVVSGVEYMDIAGEVADFVSEEGGMRVALGKPLLTGAAEATAHTVAALLASLPAERGTADAVLWMGHGSRHASTALYSELGRAVQAADTRVFVGTINGDIRFEHLLPLLKGYDKVWLMPLLAVVGRHALEDMAGTSPHSWRARLEEVGFSCAPILKGMIEYPAFVRLWLEHLSTALDTAARPCTPLREAPPPPKKL